MSIEHVQEIIGKALNDSEYRELLFSDPNKALEGYDLSEEEVKALEELEAEEFEAISGELEERISRASLSAVKRIDKSGHGILKLFGFGGDDI